MDVGDQSGRTPLHLAAAQGHAHVSQLLLSLGASMYVQEGVTKSTPLHFAAAAGHLNVIKVLLDHCEEDEAVNWLNGEGRSPLMLACLMGHTECVQHLLTYNARVDSPDLNGHGPLHAAAGNGYEEIVEALIQCEANIMARDKSGKTALQYAAMAGHVPVLSTLHNNMKDIDVVDRFDIYDLCLFFLYS